jgi:hydrogenase maturation factor
MREGKIGYDELQRIIDTYGYKNRGMIMGPSIGVDCSVFDLGKKLLVATSDPVTFVSSGYYCINVNVNDVVSMGAKPLFFMATIILPPESRENELEKIMQEIQSGCRKFRVNFAGGHTETNSIVNRPLISGFMTGTCRKDELRGSFNAKDGDMVLITKGIGIEGTAIIAEKRERLIEKRFGKKFLKTCLSHRRELSVYKEAMMARKSANGMHDATEGGIINALYEMCVASGMSMDIDRFPVGTETRRLCDLFGIEPLGLISSGTLVITTKDTELAGRLEERGIRAYEIGRVVKDGKNEVRHDGRTMKTFVRDEIARI